MNEQIIIKIVLIVFEDHCTYFIKIWITTLKLWENALCNII